MSENNYDWTESAAEELERLNFKQKLAGKEAEISFLVKALSDQTRRVYQYEKANASLLKELEKIAENLRRSERAIDRLESAVAYQVTLNRGLSLARGKLANVRKILDNVPSCFEPNPGSIKALLLKALEGEDEGGEPDLLHVKLEAEIQDQAPPLRKGGNGQKPETEKKPPVAEAAGGAKTKDPTQKILAQISGEEGK